jgi:hypothetical protein
MRTSLIVAFAQSLVVTSGCAPVVQQTSWSQGTQQHAARRDESSSNVRREERYLIARRDRGLEQRSGLAGASSSGRRDRDSRGRR